MLHERDCRGIEHYSVLKACTETFPTDKHPTGLYIPMCEASGLCFDLK